MRRIIATVVCLFITSVRCGVTWWSVASASCNEDRAAAVREKSMTKTLRLLTAGFVALLFATLAPAAVPAQAKDPITAIRQHYTAINKRAARYRKFKKELSGYSLEGG